MNIPNTLTLMRFCLIPVFVYFFFSGVENSFVISAGIFLLAGITDVLDGYIARHYNMVTKWGKLLDPLADKSMQLAVIISLCYKGLVPAWMIYIILCKELLMVIGSIMLYKDEIVVSASWYGKAATFLFYLAILSIIIFKMDDLQKNFLIGIAVGSALFAFVRYSLNFKHIKYPKDVLVNAMQHGAKQRK